jgi:hypothetical protein
MLPYIRKTIAFFEGFQALPAGPYDRIGIKVKMSKDN